MKGIYADYRGETFFKVRNSWEPWYTKGVNGAFNEDTIEPKGLPERRAFMQSALDEIFPPGEMINGCIDFGGDHGQFFPENTLPPRILVDLSEKPAMGITVHKSLHDVLEPVDLVMNCNVIEHMNEIDKILNEMRGKLTPRGVVYIELPLDRFRVAKFHRRQIYKTYLDFLGRHKGLFTSIDFVSGLFRQLFGYVPFFGIVKQSEHINYFSKLSIAKLVEQAQASIVFMSPPDEGYRVGHIRQGRIGVVLR